MHFMGVFDRAFSSYTQVGFVDNDRELRRKLKAIDHMDDSRCLKGMLCNAFLF